MTIVELFDKNNILYKLVACSNNEFFSSLPISVIQYLNCMGKTINLNITSYGSACTTLFSLDEIQEFIEMAVENKNYPIDGTKAEELFKMT